MSRKSMHLDHAWKIAWEVLTGIFRSVIWKIKIGRSMKRVCSWYGEFVLPHEPDVSYNVMVVIADLHPYRYSRRAVRLLGKVLNLEEHECDKLSTGRAVTREHLLEHVCMDIVGRLLQIKGAGTMYRGLTYRPWLSPYFRIYLDLPLTREGTKALLSSSWGLLEQAMAGTVITEAMIITEVYEIALAELNGQNPTEVGYKNPVRAVRERYLRRVKKYLRETEGLDEIKSS